MQITTSYKMEPLIGLWSFRRAVIGFLVMVMAVGVVYGQPKDMYGNSVSQELCNQFAFDSDLEVERLVSKILGVYNLDNGYKIGACGSIKNAVALQDKGAPVILYNPEFLNKIKSYSFSESDLPSDSEDWAVLLVLAHEIGHHLNNHITNPHPGLSEWDKELKADETAGNVLYLLNAPNLATAQRGLKVAQVSEKGTFTHPPRQMRLDAFKRGWDKAANKYPRPGSIDSLNCASAQWIGELFAGKEESGVRLLVPYLGGDGGVHGGQLVVSSGIPGLTATVAGGRFAEGPGTLEYLLSGVPLSSGRGQFGLKIGGASCAVSVEVAEPVPELFAFTETFSNNYQKWGEWDQIGSNAGLVDQAYRITSTAGGSWFSTIPVDFDASKNYEISATVKKLKGTDEFYFGMALGYDILSNKLHFAGITGMGHYCLMLFDQNSPYYPEYLIPSNNNSVVHPGNATNYLSLRKIGDKFSLYVNGTLMGEAPAQQLIGNRFGFYLWSGSSYLSVDFDNFRIKQLK